MNVADPTFVIEIPVMSPSGLAANASLFISNFRFGEKFLMVDLEVS